MGILLQRHSSGLRKKYKKLNHLREINWSDYHGAFIQHVAHVRKIAKKSDIAIYLTTEKVYKTSTPPEHDVG